MESSGCESDALLLESSRILPPTDPVSAREGRAYISTLRHWWIALVQELEAQGRPVSQLTEARGQQFLALCRRTLTYQREPDEDWRGNLCFLQRELEVLRFRLVREAEFHPVIRRLEAMWEASARQLCDRGRRLLGLRVRERDWDNVGSWRTSEPFPPCPDNIDEGTWELVLTAPWSEISRRLRMECWSLTRLLWLAARFAPLPFQRIREHIDGYVQRMQPDWHIFGDALSRAEFGKQVEADINEVGRIPVHVRSSLRMLQRLGLAFYD